MLRDGFNNIDPPQALRKNTCKYDVVYKYLYEFISKLMYIQFIYERSPTHVLNKTLCEHHTINRLLV